MEGFLAGAKWDPEKAAGVLLAAALFVPILMLALFAVRGALPDVFAQIGGRNPNSFVRNLSLTGWITAGLLSLAGFSLLTTGLRNHGEVTLSALAHTGMVVTTVLLVLEATVHLAFGAWAADELLRTGSEPALYSVFFAWSSVILQRVYLAVGYTSLMLYGGALLSAGWLPAWTGWLCLLWGGGMAALLLASGTTLPATLLIPGAILGMSLITGP